MQEQATTNQAPRTGSEVSPVEATIRAVEAKMRLARPGPFTSPKAPHLRGAVLVRDSHGRAGWYMSSPRCRTCRSPWRAEVEEAVVLEGRSFREAAHRVTEAKLTERCVRRHFRAGHHPATHWARAELQEIRSELVAERFRQ